MLMMILLMSLFLIISMILFFINYSLSIKKNNNREKKSPFECGFDPFSSSRIPFSIQFYMISLIFLIFDIEIILLIPMIKSFNLMNKFSWNIISSMIMFILMIGLYMEWNDGAITWLK